jgi:small subunit ribosomal protein S20
VANIRSQIKRNRQNERRHERNKAVRSALKTESKKVRTAITDGDADSARRQLLETSRSIDKAAAGGILHKRAAARRKSRLARAVDAVSPLRS